MKTHLLNERHCKNFNVPSEEMVNMSKCGKEIPEWTITTLKFEVTCKSCIKTMKY